MAECRDLTSAVVETMEVRVREARLCGRVEGDASSRGNCNIALFFEARLCGSSLTARQPRYVE